MSTIPTLSLPTSASGTVAQAQTALAQLGTALQTGDISAARDAYRAVQQSVSADEPAPPAQKSLLRANPTAELAEALRKDNLSAAQQTVSPYPSVGNPGRKATGAYTSGQPAAKQTNTQNPLGGLLNARV